jgi:hypothetical protein
MTFKVPGAIERNLSGKIGGKDKILRCYIDANASARKYFQDVSTKYCSNFITDSVFKSL